LYAALQGQLGGACGDHAFCHDDMAARMLTVHAGYALYEILFW
jgi:hypothetical protein